MRVLNDLFDYGLKIYQNSEYFKFSIDSILLAEFVKLHKNERILDICTGNAPIPMILSTKEESIHIDGVEIQKEIFDLAQKSIIENGLENKIHLFNIDAKSFLNAEKYDIVTCNPPYFKITETSEKNVNIIKRIARHEMYITLEDCIDVAKRNLKETGRLYMVHRVDRFLDTIHHLENKKFGIRKIVFVYTKDYKAEFFLIEASRYKKNDPVVYSIYANNKKSYKNIFEEA